MAPRTIAKTTAVGALEDAIAQRPTGELGGSITNRNALHAWVQRSVADLHHIFGEEAPFAIDFEKAFVLQGDLASVDEEQFLTGALDSGVEILNRAIAAVEAWPPLEIIPKPPNPIAVARAVFALLAAKYDALANINVTCDWKDPIWQEMGLTQGDVRKANDRLKASGLVKGVTQTDIRLIELGVRASGDPSILDRLLPLAASMALEVTPTAPSHTETKSMNPVRIFLSHDSDDANVAELVINYLKAGLVLDDDHIRCTSVAGHRLLLGADTRDALAEDIRACEIVVCLHTPDSLDSDWVILEAGAAWVLKKPAIALVSNGATFGTLLPVFKLKNAGDCAKTIDMAGLPKAVAEWTTIKKRDNPEKMQLELERLVAAAKVSRPKPKEKTAKARKQKPAAPKKSDVIDDADCKMLLRDELERLNTHASVSQAFDDFDTRAGVPMGSTKRLLRSVVSTAGWEIVEESTLRFRLRHWTNVL